MFGFKWLFDRMAGNAQVTRPMPQAEVAAILTDITRACFPDHVWLPFDDTQQPGLKGATFRLVSRAEAHGFIVNRGDTSEIPREEFLEFSQAMVEAGLNDICTARGKHPRQTGMILSGHSVHKPFHVRPMIQDADLAFLQEHRGALIRAARRLGVLYRLTPASAGPGNRL